MTDLAQATTFLFVPGSSTGRFAKALSAGADAVIIDLEDAVAPDDKSAARREVAQFLEAERRVVVRMNAAGTPWFADDLAMLIAARPLGVMLPKAESAEALHDLGARLGREVALLPLLETAAGMDALATMAGVSGVCRFAFGTVDFQLDMGIEGDDEELLAFRSWMVLRARRAGIASPIDGVTTAIDDEQVLSATSRRARRLGFGGKLCIHPRQVPVVASAFAPLAGEIAKAERIVAAAAASVTGLVVVEGRMVDRPVIELAHKTMARAARLRAQQGFSKT